MKLTLSEQEIGLAVKEYIEKYHSLKIEDVKLKHNIIITQVYVNAQSRKSEITAIVKIKS